MVKEADFSAKLRSAIRARGVYAEKVSDRFHSGVLDIYVTGGVWIESKRLVMPKSYATNIMRNFSTDQHMTSRRLVLSGDLVLGAFLFLNADTGYAEKWLVAPYVWLMREMITRSRINALGRPWTGTLDVSDIFDKNEPRNVKKKAFAAFFNGLDTEIPYKDFWSGKHVQLSDAVLQKHQARAATGRNNITSSKPWDRR